VKQPAWLPQYAPYFGNQSVHVKVGFVGNGYGVTGNEEARN
jgi:hypothetical protein